MKRPGFTLVEIFVAIALLAVCALLFVQLVAVTTSERVAERIRQTAVDQLQNVLERLATVPPEKLADGDFNKTAIESLFERSLPDGKIEFAAKPFETESVIFTVTVSWSNGENRDRRKVAMFRLLTFSPANPPPPEEETETNNP